MFRVRVVAVASLVSALMLSRAAAAQHDMSMHEKGSVQATAPSQAAFATIAGVVRILDADPSTDWSKVDLEALRQHLIDMDDVVMHAAVEQRNVPGGMEARVTGSGRTAGAIQRMLMMHAAMLDQSAEYRATASEIANGVLFTVTSRDSSRAASVARVRGLGFAGLLTEGDHHSRHHLAIARGELRPHSD
jgi:hypothetical protein